MILLLVFIIVILTTGLLLLLRKYKITEQERRKIQQRLDAVLQENKNLFFEQLEKYGIELNSLNKH